MCPSLALALITHLVPWCKDRGDRFHRSVLRVYIAELQQVLPIWIDAKSALRAVGAVSSRPDSQPIDTQPCERGRLTPPHLTRPTSPAGHDLASTWQELELAPAGRPSVLSVLRPDQHGQPPLPPTPSLKAATSERMVLPGLLKSPNELPALRLTPEPTAVSRRRHHRRHPPGHRAGQAAVAVESPGAVVAPRIELAAALRRSLFTGPPLPARNKPAAVAPPPIADGLGHSRRAVVVQEHTHNGAGTRWDLNGRPVSASLK